MARLIYSARALDELERVTDFLVDTDPAAAAVTVDLIAEAVAILAHHPLIGRPADPLCDCIGVALQVLDAHPRLELHDGNFYRADPGFGGVTHVVDLPSKVVLI